MKKSSIVSAIMLFVAILTLSGCLFPYWDDDGRGHGGGGYRHDNGRHHGDRD